MVSFFFYAFINYSGSYKLFYRQLFFTCVGLTSLAEMAYGYHLKFYSSIYSN